VSQENREKRSAKHQLRDRIPRIRFGLKTALALVTLLSAWLGYNAYVVRHRQELRRMIEERHLLLLEFGGKEVPEPKIYLEKPVEPEVLAEAIEKALS